MTDYEGHMHNNPTTKHQRKFDPERLQKMESQWQRFMNPATILPKFLTRTNMTLVDLGCGAGYFTIPAAKMINDGHVYAVDRQQDMVHTTLNRASAEALTNIDGIVTLATNLPIPTASVDAVLMSMMFHHVEEQTQILNEVKRVLRPNGILYIVEWDRVETEFGPPMQIRIRPDELCTMLTDNDYIIQDVSHSVVQPAVYFIEARAPQP